MNKIKKLNGSMIAAIVLSVLLIMSLTAGATLAWFASRDSATRTITMGEAVVVTVGEDYMQGPGKLAMALPVDEETQGLMPGMSIKPNIKVQLQASNTKALVRARFITTVEYPDKYEDAAFTDRVKYPDMSGAATTVAGGKVLDNYPVYTGTINYDYYNNKAQLIKYALKDAGGAAEVANDGKYALDINGARIEAGVYTDEEVTGGAHSVTIELTRVKVREAMAGIIDNNAASWDFTTGTALDDATGVAITAANVAIMEIRQRGLDLTNALNAVISGEAGYKKDSVTGELIADGVQNSRKVADGWAYRQADQCWYYLGSSTNGFELTADAGRNEAVDSTKPVAQDITDYTEIGSGNDKVPSAVYTAVAAPAGVNTRDMTRNYLADPTKLTDGKWNLAGNKGRIEAEENEIAVLNQTTIASIDTTNNKNVSIDFLTRDFALPTFIDNDYAKARVTFNFVVEAVQNQLVDPSQESTGNTKQIPNNLVNAILVFNNAFGTQEITNAKDSAVGTYFNVVPGGGTIITFDYVTGKTTVTGGKMVLDDTKLAATNAKSFAQIADADGYLIDNYKGAAVDYRRGTASTIGVRPYPAA